MKILLIDDLKTFPNCTICRTYDAGLAALSSESWDLLLLDHDLGEEKTGYDLLCWLEQNPQFVPKDIQIVSLNGAGRDKMQLVVRNLFERTLPRRE